MILFQLLLLLFIVVIFTTGYKTNYKTKETYDGRISGVSKEICGNLCTQTLDCSAFAYDDDSKKCYLSQRPILYQSPESIYSQEYNIDQFRCNKVKPLYSDINIKEIEKDELQNNMLYFCQEKELADNKLYKIGNNNMIEIDEANYKLDVIKNKNTDFLELRYPLYEIEWPKNRKDININEMYNKENNKLNSYTTFEKRRDEYIGEYLYPYQCVKNIPENICIQSCAENRNCVGVEYNPLYEKQILDLNSNKKTNNIKNVCCLKKTIESSMPRRNEFKHGYFLEKKQLDDLSKSYVYVIN